MKISTIPSIKSYYVNVPYESREKLLELRRLVLKHLDGYNEVISYGVPTFIVDSKRAVAIGVDAKKVKLYLIGNQQIFRFENELEKYTHGKTMVGFDVDAELPKPLISKLLRDRLSEVREK